MKMIIKGLERVDYTSKKTDRPVDGVRLHVERKDPNVVGVYVEQIFVATYALENMGCVLPADKYQSLIGKPVEIEYNRFGRVVGVCVTA